MKKTRKLWAFLLAMIMVLAMGMSAMAGDQTVGTVAEDKGSIIITNAVKGQTYTVYKIFSATNSADGSAISYVATNEQKAITGFDTYFDTDANNTVSIKDAGKDPVTGKLSAAAVAWIKEKIETLAIGTDVSETKTDEGGSLIFAGLDYGYYYIDSTNGSVVTVDSTTPNAEVIDKNPTPTLDKDIASVNGDVTAGADNETGETATAQIGDIINYSVTITAQKGAENYVFRDKLSSGLTLKEDSKPVVKVGDTTLIEGRDYVLTKFDNEELDGKDDIVITFTETYLNTITTETDITITYSAILNENAVVEDQDVTLTGNKNSATLEYGHKTDSEKNITPPDEPKVYTYKFSLVKDNSEKVVLTGAKFKIYNSETGGSEIQVVKKSEGVYRVANLHNGESGVEIEAGSPSIEGLAADRVYWLEEIEAPAGYNKLTSRVKIILTTAKDTNGVVTGKGAGVIVTYLGKDKTAGSQAGVFDGKYSFGGVEVVNEKGVELPSTGGIGTTMFYVAGGALVLAAVVLLVTRKRMSVEK